MDYKYIFEREDCWWKDVCKNYSNRDCNGCCIRYMKMHFLTNSALLTKAQQHPNNLVPDAIDRESFMILYRIKEDAYNYITSGKNLLIYSNNNGNGKTQWSLKIMMKYRLLV